MNHCGLIIHESRFTFRREGFIEIVDLGELWEKAFHLPLPLGGIFAHRSLSEEKRHTIISHLRSSLLYAWEHPDASHSFILSHSQEKEWEVVKQHIDLYVNQETYKLSPNGEKAVEILLQCGKQSLL